jgi:hypothetical protein
MSAVSPGDGAANAAATGGGRSAALALRSIAAR